MLLINKLWAGVRSVLQFRVKRWNVAQSGWDEKDIRVLICLEDSIWYWVVLEWACDNRICRWLHSVSLPGFIRKWERHWDKDEPEYFAKFEDWWGDDFGCIWHLWVCDPLLQWVWKHKDIGKVEPSFEMTLDEAKQKFAHDPDIWEWVEKSLAEHKQYDAEKAAEEGA